MTNLSLKLILQSYSQEKIYNIPEMLDVSEILILTVLLKKIARRLLDQDIIKSLCANLFHIEKKLYTQLTIC